MYYLVGLGNPGEEYENTRHNTGRMFAAEFCEKTKEKISCILPDTYMNKSGLALKKIITSKKKAKSLIVVHDDIDLPLGKFKVSFGKGSAGHKGVESVMRAVKTKDFYRLRIGTSPTTPGGKLKKPKGEQKILDFLMGEFKPKEKEVLKKVFKQAFVGLENIIRGKIK